MASKIVAFLALSFASVALTLGNYWHTFGLWPKSWVAFFGFAVAQAIVASIIGVCLKEK